MNFTICMRPLDAEGKRGSVDVCIEPATNGNVRLVLRRVVPPKKNAQPTTSVEALGEISVRELEAAVQSARMLMAGGAQS